MSLISGELIYRKKFPRLFTCLLTFLTKRFCDNNPMRCTDLFPASISPYMEGVGLMEDSLEDSPDGFLNLSTAKGPGLGGSVSVM